ncbi:MAG TPA: acyltransferase [Acidimicrobiales bacterium]|nr:acyltransferase [Acidimicrobiales bacterium]
MVWDLSLEERRPVVSATDGVVEGRGSFRPDIQGLRAVAVVLVVLVHAAVPGLEGGYVGVDIFFVISGFVITGLLLRQPSRSIRQNLAYFYARRIRRIVPAATLTLVVTVVAAYLLLGVNFESQLLGDVRWASMFAANFRLINTGSNYFIPGVAPSLVTHYWSLAVEEQFYLFYPLVVFSLTWITPRRYRELALAVFLIAAIVVSGWWSFHLTPLNAVQAYYSPFTRFWELALGGLVAVIPAAWARRSPRWNSALAVVAVIVLGTAVWRLNANSAFPGVLAWWPCAASAVLLWTGQASVKGAPASWLSWRPLRYVGDISYSLYLWHYPWLMLPLQLVHPLSSPMARVIEVAGATACAVLSYHFVENPIRHSRRLSRDGWSTALLLLICVALSWNATLLIGRLAHVS